MRTLRPGLSFCRVADRFVFLDLPNDRFFCLGREAAAAFEAALASGDDEPFTRAPEGLAAVAAVLVAGTGTGPLRACTVAPVTGSLPNGEPSRVGILTVAEIMLRRLGAEAELGRLGLAQALAGLERRKRAARLYDRPDVVQAASDGFARAALLRRRTSRCLSISVATMRWLTARQCAATLVIGVKLHPFAAHCWVQANGFLINDAVDDIRPFVPILAV